MAIRTEIIRIEEDFEDLKIAILDIENEIFAFDSKIKTIELSNNEAIPRLQDCILHYRNVRNKLRGFLKPEDNKYIDSDTLNKMDEDIGRLDDDINKKEKQIIDKLSLLDFQKKSESRNIKINPLKNLLIEAMEIQIINSLVKSTEKWRNYKEKEIEVIEEGETKKVKILKDIHLFNYYLFQEMYIASQSIGGFTRQEIKSFPKNITLYNKNPTEHKKDTNEDTSKETEHKDFDEDMYDGVEEKDGIY